MARLKRPHRRQGQNRGRRHIAALEELAVEDLARLAAHARYEGNPEHKRNPAAYGLPNRNDNRTKKTLCDELGAADQGWALQQLREGLRRGMVSRQWPQDWPKTVWAVAAEGHVLEARQTQAGVYHGYPLLTQEDFLNIVREEWNRREELVSGDGQ